MLFPENHNQQHVAVCILFELKWSENLILPSLSFIEQRYVVSSRILQRARAKLSRVGLIEHISSFNCRYNGKTGWKLSSKFEAALKKMADKSSLLSNKNFSSKEKDEMFISLTDARRLLVTDSNSGGDV